MRGLIPIEVLVLQSATPCVGEACCKQIAPPDVATAALHLLRRGALTVAPCHMVPGGSHVITNELGRWLLAVQQMLSGGVA